MDKPVAWLEPEWGEKICPEVGYEVTITNDHPRDLCWIPLYAHPLQNTNETDEEIKAKCPRTDSIWSLGWYEGYKACNKNTAQAYLKGFDEAITPASRAKERLIRIMGTFDLATGHADTFDELLDSLESELRDVLGHYREALKENIGSSGMPVDVPVTPPQRPWVGLTDADWKEIEDMPDTFDQGVAWAQAKLKEKNK